MGKALLDGGPLVTNIQVDVSEAGVKTTYKLDLYTSSFGKLQKQKQDEISKISRERQKLRDERNALIRKGIGKNQNTTNYGQQYDQLRQNMNISIANGGMTTITQGIASAMTTFSMTARKYTSNRWSSEGDFGSGSSEGARPVGDHEKTDYTVEGSIIPNGAPGEVMSSYIGEDGLAQSWANSVAATITDIYTPATNEPFHPNMASRPDPFPQAKKSLYFNEDTPFTENDVV